MTHGVAGVSVLHRSCMAADAWSTALMVMGRDEGMRLALERDLAALVVTRRALGAHGAHDARAGVDAGRVMNDSMGSLIAAAGVIAGYTAFTGAVLASHRRRRLRGRPAVVVPDSSGPAETIVAYASQTGFAEQLAEKTTAALRGAGARVDLTALHALDVARLTAARRALFIVSTTGEGDAPDIAAAFVRTVMAGSAALGKLSYAVLAPGDRSYARYCAFGHTLDAWLQRQGASPLFPLIDVDNGDARALDRWGARLTDIARVAGTSATDAVASTDWAPPRTGAGGWSTVRCSTPAAPARRRFTSRSNRWMPPRPHGAPAISHRSACRRPTARRRSSASILDCLAARGGSCRVAGATSAAIVRRARPRLGLAHVARAGRAPKYRCGCARTGAFIRPRMRVH